ncbi:MAG: hypothetical protein JWO67_58, partial [Streptosporangiaceae bacterium]|nr:hypothetical protein [Streptosporangiaceae bacterium]
MVQRVKSAGSSKRGGILKARRIQVKIAIPLLGEISGEWEPEEAERDASWEFYVELITRIAVVELRDDEGMLREALTSMYSLFAIARDILRRYGPAVAPVKRSGEITFGNLAVTVLNDVLRPFLSRWHPRLAAWEATRPAGFSPVEHERAWPPEPALRQEVADVRVALAALALTLGTVSGSADVFLS